MPAGVTSMSRRERSTRAARLETDKLIRCKWDAPRTAAEWYELTEPGRKRLSAQAREWHEYASACGRCWPRFLDLFAAGVIVESLAGDLKCPSRTSNCTCHC